MDKSNPLYDLQESLLQLQKEIHQFCVKENIPYFLIGGSLLGAIRHNGFIPWDDDLDIGMSRDNYEKFIQSFPKSPLAEKGYLLKVPDENESENFLTFTKVLNPKILLDQQVGEKSPLFIDIFPFDAVPKGKFQQKWQYYMFYFYYDAVKFRVAKTSNYSGKKKILYHLVKGLTAFSSLSSLKKKRNHWLLKYNQQKENGGYVNFSSAYGFHKEIFYENEMEDLQPHAFEDTELLIPKTYDAFLTRMYGNYMQLPPEDKQKPTHIVHVSKGA